MKGWIKNVDTNLNNAFKTEIVSLFCQFIDDQSGYASDGPSQKYSMYYKSMIKDLDKNKSSSTKGLKSIFGKTIQTHSRRLSEDEKQQLQGSFRRGSLRATVNNGQVSLKPLRYSSRRRMQLGKLNF